MKNIDQEIMVSVPESKLYVRVRGNVEKPLIINLHGGPGGYSGIDIKLTGPAVEDSALMALMKYPKEEYAQVGEKAEIVNRAFRNNSEYNNINIEAELSKITTPTIVVQGDQDYVVGKEHAQLINNALTNLSEENKELHILPNTGH